MNGRINPAWRNEIESLIFQNALKDQTITYRPAAQWLIEKLSTIGIPFKIFNLGLGVVKISLRTDVCPCCHQTLNKEKK